MNQRVFDNQHTPLLTAAEAAKLLGVKRATIYAYASRGWLGRATKGPGSRALYPRSAVERLKLRARARSGHTAVAAGALRWGEPVLDTAVSALTASGPTYRGRSAIELAERGTTFEACAEWLWASNHFSPWPAAFKAPGWLRLPPPGPGSTLSRLLALVATVALNDDRRFAATPEAELERARALIRLLAERAGPFADRALKHSGSIAATLGLSLRGSALSAEEEAAVNIALVLSADHELNASTFTARIAASAGCDLYACVGAALATLSGPRHGGACDRVEAMLSDIETPGRAAAELRARQARGEPVPGFEPMAYPAGDPRGPPLMAAAFRVVRLRSRLAVIESTLQAAATLTGESPSVDFGLVAVSRALGFGAGAAGAMFAVGRMAGWVAHILEQRLTNTTIRPRARYASTEKNEEVVRSTPRAAMSPASK